MIMDWNHVAGYTVSMLVAPMIYGSWFDSIIPHQKEIQSSACVSECGSKREWERQLLELPYLQQIQPNTSESRKNFTAMEKVEILTRVINEMLINSDDLDPEFGEIMNRRFADLI